MSYECRVCGVLLVVGENITQYMMDSSQYICKKCKNKQQNDHRHATGVCKERNHDKGVCSVCGVMLIVGENITQYRIDHSDYRCKNCNAKRIRNWNHLTGRRQPMSKNHDCASFLGIYVAERVLANVFDNVRMMPINNAGFDFICGKGCLIDVKSSCRRHHLRWSDSWVFTINKNQIADYFLCVAFNSREDLDPEHAWLIPAIDINDKTGVGISVTTIDKWDEYRLDIDKVITCCDAMKEGNT